MAAAAENLNTATKRSAEDDEAQPPTKKLKSLCPLKDSPLDGTIFAHYIETCLILVGPSRTPFTVHTHLLNARCPSFCETLLAQSGSPSTATQFRLEDFAPLTFRIFHIWLYTSRLAASPLAGDPAMTGANNTRLVRGGGRGQVPEAVKFESLGAEIMDIHLVELYDFGVEQRIPALCNIALSTLALQNERFERTSSMEAVALAFSETYDRTRLRGYLVDEASRRLSASNVSNAIVKYNASYVRLIQEKKFRKDKLELFKMPFAAWEKRLYDYHVGPSDHKLRGDCERTCSLADLCLRPTGRNALACDLLSDTGTIVAGFEKVPFLVHLDLVCRHSDYFRGAFRGGFSETGKGVVELRDESVKDVALFLSWLYTGKVKLPSMAEIVNYRSYALKAAYNVKQADGPLPELGAIAGSGAAANHDPTWTQYRDHSGLRGSGGVSEDSEDDDGEESESDTSEASEHGATISQPPHASANHPKADLESTQTSWSPSMESEYSSATQELLIDLFIFADRREIPALRNDIINVLAEQREDGWPLISGSFDRVGVVFSSLPPGSALCRFFIEEAAYCWDHQTKFVNDLDKFPSEFTVKVMQRMLGWSKREDIPRPPSWRRDLCGELHDHASKGLEISCPRELQQWRDEMAKKNRLMEPVRFQLEKEEKDDTLIRILLVAVGRSEPPYKARVTPTTTVANVIEACRRHFEVSKGKIVSLRLAGRYLDSSLRVGLTDIQDMASIDVCIS